MPDEILRRLDEGLTRMEELAREVVNLQAERHQDIEMQAELTRQLVSVRGDQRRDRRRANIVGVIGIIAVLGVIGTAWQSFRISNLVHDWNDVRVSNRASICQGINSGFEQGRRDVRAAVAGVGAEFNAPQETLDRVSSHLSTPGTVDLDCNGDESQTILDYLPGAAPAGLPVPTGSSFVLEE